MNCYVKYGGDGTPLCWTRTEYTLLETDGLRRVSEEALAALEAATIKEASNAEH